MHADILKVVVYVHCKITKKEHKQLKDGETTFKANIPKREDPLRARSVAGGQSFGILLINNP